MSIDRLKHAEHNFSACEALRENGAFPDWVATTAYYAANHFIKYALFPIEIEGVEYGDLDQCHFNGNRGPIGKHELLVRLVKEHFPSIGRDFEIMHNDCISARYIDYDISPAVAERSFKALSKIRDFCKEHRGKRKRTGSETPKPLVQTDKLPLK